MGNYNEFRQEMARGYNARRRFTRRRVGKNGVQMFRAAWWFWHEQMAGHIGSEVEVAYSDDDFTRIWVDLPGGAVEAALLTGPGSVWRGRLVEDRIVGNLPRFLRPDTMEMIARQRESERAAAREYQVLEQNAWRGETVEDRVAAMINPAAQSKVDGDVSDALPAKSRNASANSHEQTSYRSRSPLRAAWRAFRSELQAWFRSRRDAQRSR